jgi:KaiC/GvpD/RAD55 family RecA-like ATPase
MSLDAAAAAAMWADPEPAIVTVEAPPYRHYKPLADAANDFVTQARTLRSGERIYTGIEVFDDAMRGLAPKELMVVQGFAHSGKTLLTTAMIEHNRTRRVVLFTADEDRVLVLVKLTSLSTGISAESLEQRIADGDTEAEELVRRVASQDFPNLAVFDQESDLRSMSNALDEVTEAWGARPELVIFDYLDLLSVGEGEGNTPTKMNAIKAWGKKQAIPLVVLHQASRTKGADGAEMTITSGAYGGEQQATFIVGVRRKKSFYKGIIAEFEAKIAASANPSEAMQATLEEAKYNYTQHLDTLTVNLVKNKRPPGRLVDDVDFTLEMNTGRLLPYEGRAMHTRTSNVGAAGVHAMRQQVASRWDEVELDF